MRVVSKLSVGPSCVTQPNPLQVKKFGPNPTQPSTINNGAYSLVVKFFLYKELILYF